MIDWTAIFVFTLFTIFGIIAIFYFPAAFIDKKWPFRDKNKKKINAMCPYTSGITFIQPAIRPQNVAVQSIDSTIIKYICTLVSRTYPIGLYFKFIILFQQ